GRCRQHAQVLTNRKLPGEILFDGETLPQQIVRQIGDAESAAAKDALNAIAVDAGAARQGVARPRHVTPAGISAHAADFAASWPVAPSKSLAEFFDLSPVDLQPKPGCFGQMHHAILRLSAAAIDSVL